MRCPHPICRYLMVDGHLKCPQCFRQIEPVTDANIATEVARREATARTKGKGGAYVHGHGPSSIIRGEQRRPMQKAVLIKFGAQFAPPAITVAQRHGQELRAVMSKKRFWESGSLIGCNVIFSSGSMPRTKTWCRRHETSLTGLPAALALSSTGRRPRSWGRSSRWPPSWSLFHRPPAKGTSLSIFTRRSS